MSIQIQNSTYYRTEDIHHLLNWMMSTFTQRLLLRGNNQVQVPVTSLRLALTYAMPDAVDEETWVYEPYNRRTSWTHSGSNPTIRLRVARKSKLVQSGVKSLSEGLSSTVDRETAPVEFSKQIIKQVITTLRMQHPILPNSHVMAEIQNKNLAIGIDRDATKVKRLTKEESVQRLLEMYGPGKAMQGSRRTWSGHWRLERAEHYYYREWLRREEWRKKYEAKGGILESHWIHETYPEYLRRIADEMEQGKHTLSWKKK